MRRKKRDKSAEAAKSNPASVRNRLAALLALATTATFAAILLLAESNAFLMPGPLHSAHGSIENCSTCHTKNGDRKLSWLHGLIAGDPLADSKACLACHQMPKTAFNAHGASANVIDESTARLAKYAANLNSAPLSAQAQSLALPIDKIVARGLFCATCHQEHQGAGSNLKKITDGQCRSCHLVKFDSFDGNHPEFATYPFRRRTRIIYDHAGHFGKHYLEVATKEPTKQIPKSCSSCHETNDDDAIMAVASFDKTCSTCHLSQITGEQRASGPKGIAFLALPGIDLDVIRKRKGEIGEWPDGSQAPLTPFMKVMIGRSDHGRALIQLVSDLDLQDLTAATDEEIKAVTDLVLEIKSLFFALISGNASDLFAGLKLGTGAAPGSDTIAGLLAGLPREVLIAAQQRYLPNLAAEISGGPSAGRQSLGHQTQKDAEPAPAAAAALEKPAAAPEAPEQTRSPEASKAQEQPDPPDNEIEPVQRNPQACLARVFGQCVLFKSEQKDPGSAFAPPSRLGRPHLAGVNGARVTALPKAGPGMTKIANTDAKTQGAPRRAAGARRQGGSKATHDDELLFPTEAELRAINEHRREAGRDAQSSETSPRASSASGAALRGAPNASITSDVDAESWARLGGWYQQDHAIYYRPAGHKDPFIYTWLSLTGSPAPADGQGAAAAVFDQLTDKDAPGSCVKCHSVDQDGKQRSINFSPLTAAARQGRFTRFIHEPHFNAVGKSGCQTCHTLEKTRSYLKSYERGDPMTFSAEFSSIKINTCQNCHTASKVRQDCLSCHTYHVNGVITPLPETNLQLP